MVINTIAVLIGIWCFFKVIVKGCYSKRIIFSLFMIMLSVLYFIFKSLMYLYVRNANSLMNEVVKMSNYFRIYTNTFELAVFIFIIIITIINIFNLCKH